MKLLRFKHLKEDGVVESWPQLKRLVDGYGFPSGRYIGPNTRVWTPEEIAAYLESRPTNRDDVTRKPHPKRNARATA
jgi:hypothetical protein